MKKLNRSFCCKAMLQSIEEHKIIEYDMVDRSYGILVGENCIDMLTFCPWCGVKLPERISMNTFFDVLEEEYGMTDLEALKDDFANVPDEFKTDEWWRKRGL